MFSEKHFIQFQYVNTYKQKILCVGFSNLVDKNDEQEILIDRNY